MTIFAPSITTTAINEADAYAKVQAYRKLFNIYNSEVLTFVKAVFYDKQGNCVFLHTHAATVTITARSIKWYDPACGREITIKNNPSDGAFELTIRV